MGNILTEVKMGGIIIVYCEEIMTKIDFESDGFTLEQKFNGKKSKTFIYFDNVSNKTGYFKNINYYNIIFAIIFIVIVLLDLRNNNFRILSLFYIAIIIYFIYDFIKNFQNYITLTLTYSRDLFFTKKESKFIDEILNKRNKYFKDNYLNNIGTYDSNKKIETINWLYKEGVIDKIEISKIDGVKYNEEKDEFYLE